MLAVHNPNLLPYSIFGKNMAWMHPAGRLIWACVIFVIGLAVIVVMLRRPKSPEPPTWAQSMLGALAAFSLMLLAYGTIPHEWIVYANSYLNWSAAKFVFQKNRFIHFDVTKQAANDASRRAHLRRDAHVATSRSSRCGRSVRCARRSRPTRPATGPATRVSPQAPPRTTDP